MNKRMKSAGSQRAMYGGNFLQRLLFIVIAGLTWQQGQAQPYSFINYASNVLYQPDGSGMKNFFKALKDLEDSANRKVNIVHIGDSHIQADFFSGRVRDLLQHDRRFANGGRGLVFPYRAAQTNNPVNYRTSFTGAWTGKTSVRRDEYSKWGLAGFTAVTYDSKATITITPNDASSKITRVKIFYPIFDAASFNVNIITDARNLASSYMSRDGFVEYEFRTPQKSITIGLNKLEPSQKQFVMQGIVLENDDAGIVYHSVGINGADVKTYFRCEDFDKHLRVLKPDLVIISLGTNDAHTTAFDDELYKNNFKFLISEIRKAAPRASILMTTPGDAYRRTRYVNPNNAKAGERLYQIADELKIALWDFYNVMGGLRSVDKWYENGLAASDKLHLTQKGYTFQGELLYEAITESYKKFWERQVKN